MPLCSNASVGCKANLSGIRHRRGWHLLARQVALYIPSVVVGEYGYGILGSSKQAETARWFAGFLNTLTVLDVTAQTAGHYAAIFRELKLAGTPIPTNDVWIAALVREHQLPLLSRDAHFDHVRKMKRVSW